MVEEEEQAGIPEWVVTFGDMMSLLLTFFIMLVSMSEIKDEQRYQAMLESMRRRFGHDSAMASIMPGEASQARNSHLSKMAVMGRSRRIDTMRGGDKVRAPVGENPRVQSIRPAADQTVGGVLIFPEGTSTLSKKHKKILRDTAREIGGKPQKIEIRGHTSNRPLPPDTPYRDHWELAYARCVKVKDFLVELGIDPKRIRIGVAAENEPLHVADDPLLLKENPRVEVFMLNEIASDLVGTAAEKAKKFSSGKSP